MVRISKETFDRAAREEARRRARASLDRMTDEEDRAITEAALADPDAQPVDDLFRRKRGRPPLPETKEKVSLRLDRDIVEHFRSGGEGWQTRLNDTLRRVVDRNPPKGGEMVRHAETGRFVSKKEIVRPGRGRHSGKKAS